MEYDIESLRKLQKLAAPKKSLRAILAEYLSDERLLPMLQPYLNNGSKTGHPMLEHGECVRIIQTFDQESKLHRLDQYVDLKQAEFVREFRYAIRRWYSINSKTGKITGPSKRMLLQLSHQGTEAA